MITRHEELKIDDDSTNPKDLIGCKKPPISLVPPSVIIYLAQAFKNGAAKYGPYNWRNKKVKTTIYIDATMRHLLAYLDGEEVADDSGFEHLAHAVASLAVLIDAKETGNLVDDRPTPGAAPKLIKRFQESKL
jgi:cation transport regulator ChaB